MRKLILRASFLISFFVFTNIVYALCDVNITESLLPFTINQNNTYYCLNETSYIGGQTAITFANPTQNSTLDCLGYNLDSNDVLNTYGVYLTGSNTKNNTIKNCNITDFYNGVYFYNGPNNNTVTNVTASSNNDGVRFGLSPNNQISDSKLFDNNYMDFSVFPGSSDDMCNNVLTNVNGTENKPIVYYNSTVTIKNWNNNVSEIFLCNADNSVIENVTLNRTGNQNNGILLGRTDYTNITNVNIINLEHVLLGSHSSNNRLTNVTINSNNEGIRIWLDSNNNTLTNVTSHYSGIGIRIGPPGEISFYNNIIGGSFAFSTSYDYQLVSGEANNFTDTNFTDSRTIRFDDTESWFIYNNESSGNIWLKTNVSAVTTITRKLISWNQSLMQWNDSSNPIVTARYNITGLSPNTIYKVFNNSVLTYTLQTDSNGDLNFTIYLSSEHEIKLLLISKADGSSCTSNSECSGGYCVHNICRSTPTYCGDGYCDSGESCDICVLDCGFCPGDGETPSPLPTEYQPPEEPTEFPTEEITLPVPGTSITIPETGLTVRLEPKFVITLYPLKNRTAIIHNISEIEEPSKYKILLCNQTLIASYEINITVDLAYFCANYSGYNIEDPTVNVFKFKENDWIPLKTEDIAKNSEKKIICGKITFTPYMVTGFTSTVDSQAALLAIQTLNNTITTAIEQGIDVSKAKESLEKAWMEYYSCNYAKAKELADKALESLVTIPPWLIPVSFVAIAIVAIAWFWYYTVRIKVRVKK